jgi:hypothetical protein
LSIRQIDLQPTKGRAAAQWGVSAQIQTRLVGDNLSNGEDDGTEAGGPFVSNSKKLDNGNLSRYASTVCKEQEYYGKGTVSDSNSAIIQYQGSTVEKISRNS